MRKLHIAWANLVHDRKGVTAIEYAVLAGAVAAVVTAVFATDSALTTTLENALKNVLTGGAG